MNYNDIFSNNQNWKENIKSDNPEYFNEMAKGQSPPFLYIGCADSRVSVELFTGAKPGEIFVHRNVANVVDNTDHNISAVIEYAVDHLKVKHIVVCGHTNCGGVKGAMVHGDLGMINPWLRNIRDVYRLHKAELDGIADEDARYDRLVELNVEEQCVNVLKMPVVHQKILGGQELNVHGWVFDIRTGILHDQNFDASAKLNELKGIYEIS